MTDRNEFLLSLFDQSGTGLEIGPSYNPIVPKSSGLRIETLDYTTAEQLRNKYAGDPAVDISKIEELDYVSNGRSIREAIGKTHFFDYILASHVVEHLPDLIGFLKDCELLLKPAGKLILAVPDKRYRFDVFQPLTGTGDLLQAHLERRTKPPAGKVFDFIAYRALRGNVNIWNGASKDKLSFEFTLEQAKDLFESTKISSEHQDIDTWTFTPSSFRLILNDLVTMNAIDLKEETFHETRGCEFYITLSTNAGGCPIGRLSLACRVLEEQRNIFVENCNSKPSKHSRKHSQLHSFVSKKQEMDFPHDLRITQLSDTPPIPSFFIRFRDPIGLLTTNWNYVRAEDDIAEALVRTAGLVVVQRACSTRSRWLMNTAKAANIPVVYETDDFMLDLPPESGFKLRAEEKDAIRSMLTDADLVTCSTSPLAERLSQLNSNVQVVENYAIPFDVETIRSARERDPHLCVVNTDYFKLLAKKRELADALGEAIVRLNFRITFLGSIDAFMMELKSSFPDSVVIEPSFIPSRRKFLETLLVTHRVNVALVPLEPYTHHRFKSDIKFFDFASIGVPGIYNNPEIYRRVIHKQNGFVCDGSYDGWLEGLTFFADENARNSCGDGAYQAAHERTVKDYAKEIGSVMLALLRP